MSRYDKLKQLKKQNEKLLQERFNLLGRVMLRDKHIEELKGFIEMLNKQLEQQDLYINRYIDELKALKRMYRDDLINNFRD